MPYASLVPGSNPGLVVWWGVPLSPVLVFKKKRKNNTSFDDSLINTPNYGH